MQNYNKRREYYVNLLKKFKKFNTKNNTIIINNNIYIKVKIIIYAYYYISNKQQK